jgi:ATP-dependent DNA helicase RecQ
VAELLRLRERHPTLQWAECAVLAETWEELAPIRAICEQHGIPVTMGTVRKALPLTRIREVVQFLDLLKGSREGLVTTEILTRMMVSLQGSQPDNCWWEFLRELLEEWRKESGDSELPVSCVIEFIYETLMEQRREQTIGRGIFLSTVHSAKGMEFPHVFVPGGGWATKKELKEAEEERRVYYVAMTRAQETLCLFDRRDAPNPHTKLLDGDCLLKRESPVLALPDEALMLRRYEMLGMKDLYLDYAGRKERHDSIHQHLADLAPGDKLQALATGRSIGLYTTQGSCIALLSESGSALWRDRLDRIEGITVLAMVQRIAEDSGDKYRQLCNCDRWELPWAEVTYAENS